MSVTPGFTDMTDTGMVNVGQFVRGRYGDGDTVLVGFAGDLPCSGGDTTH